MDRINIATINARGLNNAKKSISVFEWINDHDVDIALIQETFCVRNTKRNLTFIGKVMYFTLIVTLNILEEYVFC